MRPPTFLLAVVTIISAISARADDWPCWRGPDRNGISREKELSPAALKNGARKLWTVDIGAGFSTVAVADGHVFTFGNKGNRDFALCIDADKGRQVWEHSYPCAAARYPGPRSSPAVDDTSVYILSRTGVLSCLDRATGKPRWTQKLTTTLGAQPLHWGFACSPCIIGNSVIVNINNHGAGLSKRDGAKIWTSPPGKSGYASPVPCVHGGKPALAVFSPSALCGVDLQTGRRLWSYKWKTKHDANATDPLIAGNRAFVSTSYGRGCALLDISGEAPKVLWQNKTMQTHTSTAVLIDKHIYGFSGDIRRGTPLLCLDIATGKTKWTQKIDGAGSLIAADGKLIVLTENGELVIVPASPAGYKELARAPIISDQKCWSSPVLANGRIYCRSNQGTLVCVDVRQ